MKSLRLFKKRLQELDVEFTTNIKEALWLLPDGTLLDGQFDCGARGLDHRMIEAGTKTDRYDGDKFWEEVHYDYQCVRLCPESNVALILSKQSLTSIQQELLNKSSFEIEKY